jgi:hypothetical protein
MAKRAGETGTPITTRELNRALLARQMLLERAETPAIEAIRRLAGIQAQSPYAPYYGLWSRIEHFAPADLANAIEQREAVRIALMRSTVHLVASEDALAWRPLVQPVIERMHWSAYGRYLDGVDRAELADAGRKLVDREPLTFDQLGKRLAEQWPDRNPAALAMEIRSASALVQVPPRGIWGKGGVAAHTTAETWLGRPLDDHPEIAAMIWRYLTAFGPASVKDIQTWCGLTRLAPVVESMRSDLETFIDENGRELYDLPDAPRPPAETPAPLRFLAEYDNTILSYADTSRVISPEHRKRLMTNNGIVNGTFLVDGFVRGAWKIKRAKGVATLSVTPFAPLTISDRQAIEAEGAQLLGFAASGLTLAIEIAPPD